MWIKICANTSLDDAQLAATLGADAVGFVFAPSTRRVTPADVARITPHLPSTIETLDADEIIRSVAEAGLSTVQLHGGVVLPLLQQLHHSFNGRVKLIQTVHWQVDEQGASAATVAEKLREIAADGLVDRVLIDSKVGKATGGTGVPFDWSAARATFADAAKGLRLIVAGGLRPENVAGAILGLNPWGVDVASGVEERPGRKDPDRLAAFIRNAREANNSAA
jgi:phosphoribosylanthranilate isomerase